jgi:purine-binding chemotaxis protein CheW
VLNLRGVIVPIVDLRVRFGLPAAEFNALTVTIVLSLVTENGIKEHGFVVDSVRDVVDLSPGDIKPAPEVGGAHGNEFIEAIATHDEQMLILLNAAMLACREQSPTVAAEQAA